MKKPWWDKRSMPIKRKTIQEQHGLTHAPSRCVKKYDASKAYVGVEVEVENMPHLTTNGYIRAAHAKATDYDEKYIIKTDGSLRNNGLEIVTTITPADEIVGIFSEILALLESNDKPDFSSRTSIHVHLNVMDLTSNQLKILIYSYLLIEPLIYKFVDEGRRNNIYCNRLSETYITLPKQHNWAKYTGLNLCTVNTIGTVEFRHLEGTKDVKKFGIWIALIADLYEYAFNSNDNGFGKFFKAVGHLNTDSAYLEFLREVLPNSYVDLLQSLKEYDLHTDLYDAVCYVKQQQHGSFVDFIKPLLVRSTNEKMKPSVGNNPFIIYDELSAVQAAIRAGAARLDRDQQGIGIANPDILRGIQEEMNAQVLPAPVPPPFEPVYTQDQLIRINQQRRRLGFPEVDPRGNLIGDQW